MSYINDYECVGCSALNFCGVPSEFNGTECPCIKCLVKAMCSGERFCQIWYTYEEFIDAHGAGCGL